MLPWLRFAAFGLQLRLSSPRSLRKICGILAGVGGTVMMFVSSSNGPGAGRLLCLGPLGSSALQRREMFSCVRFAAVDLWHCLSPPQSSLEICGDLAGVGGTVMMLVSSPNGPGTDGFLRSDPLGSSALQRRDTSSSVRFAAVDLWHCLSPPQTPAGNCGRRAGAAIDLKTAVFCVFSRKFVGSLAWHRLG